MGVFGMSASAAVTASLIVAGVAIGSTIASSILNGIDIWCEIDNPTFNAWQTGLNITSAVSNLAYSVGSIYNSVKGISNASLRTFFKSLIKDSEFRQALTGASKYNLAVKPNSSFFWSAVGDSKMGWHNGDLIAANIAERMGGATLETTIKSQGINILNWTEVGGETAWKGISASFALKSAGNVNALLGQGLRNASVWNTIENVILNVSPKVTSITTFTVSGASTVSRAFQIGTFFTGIMSFGEPASMVIPATD
jgi:hypothetical protein